MRSVRRLSLFNGRFHQQRPKRQLGALRTAIATQAMKGLKAQFESAKRLAIYDAIRDAWTFVEAAGLEDISDEIGRHRREGEDCTRAKMAALDSCQIAFCLAMGAPSAVTFGRTR
ncbi:hypothetical protein ACC808_31675 [Rhizobium ruizarguesonis]|jgi:nitrogen fixation protein NifX|uniref:hypothetical protein n=1 Tax=Rhizobium ruizarguesonis TaxID=2081791 RepID=UPI000381A025|nr:hypothetical protein [Rhizobium ruizarguesonis]MBY5834432.1 hypothetical protein [Rhizobium leguminosarum]NKL31344.1 hypothetical protein [Rhizobium leguminosarum bv. viciae]MBY5848819.1 hypothetical protein [Rhizobium leguminosarum]MBY5863001.1 hypothetical protein [Rhizobium leguminosarum]MBY5877460.1 hypothetical protein [Rhizobium leguminosarum]